ncbi:MAG: hypothetical protein WCA12_19665, partial [Burkholderiales bacterium]
MGGRCVPGPDPRLAPTLKRRLAAMASEALIVVAIAFLAALGFVLAYAAVTGSVGPLRVTGAARAALQICVLAAIGAYFTSFWRKG